MKKIISIFLLTLFISACGVKPQELNPPEGSNEKLFPRSYPAKQINE